MLLILFNRRLWLLAGLALGVAVAGVIFFASIRHASAPQQTTPPDSLSAYMLNAEDRSMLAEWTRRRRAGPPDSVQAWVRRHYGPFQSIGLRLMEQATLFQGDGRMPLASAKFDTTREIGEALAEAANDSFLIHQVEYAKNLDRKSLDSRAQAALDFAQAEDLLYTGQYEEAIEKYEKVISLALRANDEKLAIDASYRLLYFLDRQGKDHAVIDDGEKVVASAERVGYRWRLALTLCQIAGAYSRLNQDSTALAILAKVIPLAERLQDYQILTRSYNVQAKIYFYCREEYKQAEIALQKVLQNDRPKKFSGLAHLLQGNIDAYRGEYDRARSNYELALKLFRQFELDHLNEGLTLSSLSVLNTLTGDYENALKLEKEALVLREKEKNSNEIAWSLSNLGFIYYHLDSLDQATVVCRRALPLLQSASKIFSANTWLILGDVYLKKGDLEAAKEAFTNAENIAAIIPNQLVEGEARVRHGLIALKKGQPDRAMAYFSSASEIAQKIKEPNLIADGLLGLSRAEQILNHLDRAAEFIDQAIEAVESLRLNITPDSVRVNYFATTQELFNQAISLALARRDEGLALYYAERARTRALRDALGKTTMSELPEDQIQMITAPMPNLQTLQKSIPISAQVIEYRFTPDTLLIWLIDRQKVITRRVAISSQVLEQIVQDFLQSLGATDLHAFRARVDHNRQRVYRENHQIGRRLYQLLWEPIAEAIEPDGRLFIIPDGILHRLPFSALVTPDERFFEEQYVWVKAPSLAILAENSSPQTSWGHLQQARFLMVADDLSSVSAQTALLSDLFVNHSFLVKEAATYESLQDRLRQGANIIYFSVHAVSDEHHPLNSYIELYSNKGTNRHAQKTKVYARELLQLNFAETWLSVLNACETASGKIARGEGVLNLVRIFALGKVPIIIASLWQNDDRFSAQITSDFFKSIVNSHDYTQALHQAKLLAIQKLRRDYQFALPYFWAVFEVYQNKWKVQP